MKNLVAVAAVLALALASQCFAEDVDSKHDCKEAGGVINSAGQCVKDGVVIASPAVAGTAAAGGLSAGAVAGVAAVVAVAIAVGVSGGDGNTHHGTTGTTGSTGTH